MRAWHDAEDLAPLQSAKQPKIEDAATVIILAVRHQLEDDYH